MVHALGRAVPPLSLSSSRPPPSAPSLPHVCSQTATQHLFQGLAVRELVDRRWSRGGRAAFVFLIHPAGWLSRRVSGLGWNRALLLPSRTVGAGGSS